MELQEHCGTVGHSKKKQKQKQKKPNIHITGVQKGNKKEDEAERVLEEIMAGNSSNVAKDRNPQF